MQLKRCQLSLFKWKGKTNEKLWEIIEIYRFKLNHNQRIALHNHQNNSEVVILLDDKGSISVVIAVELHQLGDVKMFKPDTNHPSFASEIKNSRTLTLYLKLKSTNLVSQFVQFLQATTVPMPTQLERLLSYIEQSNYLLQCPQDIQKPFPTDIMQVTIDVDFLYTNISHRSGLASLKNFRCYILAE